MEDTPTKTKEYTVTMIGTFKAKCRVSSIDDKLGIAEFTSEQLQKAMIEHGLEVDVLHTAVIPEE